MVVRVYDCSYQPESEPEEVFCLKDSYTYRTDVYSDVTNRDSYQHLLIVGEDDHKHIYFQGKIVQRLLKSIVDSSTITMKRNIISYINKSIELEEKK